MRPSTSSQRVVSGIDVWISWFGARVRKPEYARLSLSSWAHFARFLQSRRTNSAGTARRKAFRHAGIPEKSACGAVLRRKPACFPQFFPQVWKTSGTDPSPRRLFDGRSGSDDLRGASTIAQRNSEFGVRRQRPGLGDGPHSALHFPRGIAPHSAFRTALTGLLPGPKLGGSPRPRCANWCGSSRRDVRIPS